MIQDTLDDFFKALTSAFGIAKPIIEEQLAQKYLNEERERITEWQDILSLPSGDARADSEYGFIVKLCNDAGTPCGGDGRNVSIPIPLLHALVIGNIRLITAQKTLSAVTYAINTGK